MYVVKAKLAKVRLDSIEFERGGGFNANERSKILELVHEYQEFLLAEWDKHYPPEEMSDDE